MNSLRIKNKQQGMTLIEILIALVLGLFLLAGVFQIFLSSKQSYRMQENMSRMQESGRFSMEFISRDVRMADYRACYSDASVAGAISGLNSVAAIPPLTLVTDSITVSQTTNACGAGVATSTMAYSIQPDVSGQPALFRSVNGAAAQALIEGIENMQILYGEDTDADGTPNYYVDSGTVVNMGNVVGVRITLTTRTLNDNLTATVTAAGDRRLRQTYSTTISVRNRL